MQNDFLKMKIAAQLGGDFGAMEELPPEIENQFLKNILQFEDHKANKQAEMKYVRKLIGNPQFAPLSSLPDEATADALKNVFEHYHKHGYNVDFIANYPDWLKKEFMTEELPEHETDTNSMMPGMSCDYIYEAF